MSIAEQNELRADRSGGIRARFHFLAGSSLGGDRYHDQQCQPAQLHFDLEAVMLSETRSGSRGVLGKRASLIESRRSPNRCRLRHTMTDQREFRILTDEVYC